MPTKLQMNSIIASLLISLPAVSKEKGRSTAEQLGKDFIAIVNSKDSKTQCLLIHPACFEDLTLIKKAFLKGILKQDFMSKIPKGHKLEISKLKDDEKPLEGIAVWPKKVTHELKISFANHIIVRYIVQDGDKWYYVVPFLTEEGLKEFAKNMAEEEKEKKVE